MLLWLAGAQCHNCRQKQSWGDGNYLNPSMCSVMYMSTVCDLVTFMLLWRTRTIHRVLQLHSSLCCVSPTAPKGSAVLATL